MRKSLLVVFIILIGSVAPAENHDGTLYFSDYRALQRLLRSETKNVDALVEASGRRFLAEVARYGRCDSNKWRVTFVTALNELNQRRLELKGHKQQALKTRGEMNLTWLQQADQANLNKVRSDQPITDFVIWYENFSSEMRQGPLQELQVYALGLDKLSDAYSRMSSACEGSPEAANDVAVYEVGIRGLIGEVSSMLGLST